MTVGEQCARHGRPVHFVDDAAGEWLCAVCWQERFDAGLERDERELDGWVAEHADWHRRVDAPEDDVLDCSWCYPFPPPHPVRFIVIDGEPFADRGPDW